VKLRAGGQERWVEGTVFEPSSPRVVTLDEVDIEAPLTGTGILFANEDRPGVIGHIGTTLGKHGVNIASFALGRREGGAVGMITVDESGGLEAAVAEIKKLPAMREARIVRL
jgi:D-3-phosphoglycerate dehydrogenase